MGHDHHLAGGSVEAVELGGVVGLDLALAVVGRGDDDGQPPTQREDRVSEQRVGSLGDARDADELSVAGIAGEGGCQRLADQGDGRLGEVHVPGDCDGGHAAPL